MKFNGNLAFRVVFLTAAATLAANASTIVQSMTIGTQATDFTKSFGAFNGFNSSLGTLTGVTAALTATVQQSGTVTNNTGATKTFTYSTNNTSDITTGPAPLTVSFGAGGASEITFSASQMYTLAGGGTANYPLSGSNAFATSPVTRMANYSAISDLNAFIGGSFSPTFRTTDTGGFTGSGNFSAQITTTEGASLTITYTYTPVATATPEPATFAGMGIGVAGLVYLRRRKKA